METDIETTKEQHKTKMSLDTLIIEVEDALTRVIGNLIWFVKPSDNDINNKGLYSPEVGPVDYNKYLGKLCYHYMFDISHKFVQKVKSDLHNIDMTNEQNKIKVWKYIWQKPNFGKNISSELNTKRSAFVYMVKTALEVIMT